MLGTPTEKNWPGISQNSDFISGKNLPVIKYIWKMIVILYSYAAMLQERMRLIKT